MINELLRLDYAKLTNDLINAHIDDLYKPIHNEDKLRILSIVDEINRTS